MTGTKLPKHWDSMTSYRSYYRSFGPMTLKVTYSSSSNRFKAYLCVAFDALIHTLYSEYKQDGETDETMLRCFEWEAKRLIRSWSK